MRSNTNDGHQMNMPKRSRAQHLGREAETFIAARLTQLGAIFHPVESGNDFGIDGRVELTKEGGLRGEEFYVQIKATEQVRFIREGARLAVAPVRTDTAVYWHSKLVPTLLIVYCRATKRLFFEWAHVSIDGERVNEAVRYGRKTVSPVVLTSNVLDDSSWHGITTEATQLYQKVVSAIYDDRGRSDFFVLYEAVANALDLLIDWLAAPCLCNSLAACDERLSKVASFLASVHTKRGETSADGYCSKPPIPQVLAVILLYRSLALWLQIVENVGDDVTRASPLHRATRITAETVKAYYLRAYSGEEDAYKRGAEAALYGHPKFAKKLIALNAPIRDLERSLTLVALVARDYLRSLRHFVFPPIPDTSTVNPMMWLGDLSKSAVLNLPAWASEQGPDAQSASE